MRSLRYLALVACTAVYVADPSFAQVEPRTCGVLDGPGCNPNQCSVLDGPGCDARAQTGVGENLQLTLGTRAAADAKRPDGDLDTIRDLLTALRACWTAPAVENAYPGMQMSMRFSLNRNGRLIGPPRVTYATHEVGQKTRDIYRDAFARSLQGCTPLPFTSGFASAIAGRPIVVRIIDNREDVRAAKPRA